MKTGKKTAIANAELKANTAQPDRDCFTAFAMTVQLCHPNTKTSSCICGSRVCRLFARSGSDDILRQAQNFEGRPHFGRHIVSFLLQQINQLLGNLLLLFGKVENSSRAILVADIRSLAVNLRGIVNFEEQPGQCFIIRFRRIEHNTYRLGITGCMAANILVRWIVSMPIRCNHSPTSSTPGACSR